MMNGNEANMKYDILIEKLWCDQRFILCISRIKTLSTADFFSLKNFPFMLSFWETSTLKLINENKSKELFYIQQIGTDNAGRIRYN
jgi:hypothetical protein